MSEEFIRQANMGKKKLINRGEKDTSMSWKNIKCRVDKSAFSNDSLNILMSSVYGTTGNCPKEGNRENAQTLIRDLILTEKMCTRALPSCIAPLGFGSVFLHGTEHSFPSLCSPSLSSEPGSVSDSKLHACSRNQHRMQRSKPVFKDNVGNAL